MSDIPREAQRLITELSLEPHPEGGWYRRIHTGTVPVTRPDGEQRPGVTLIHYLLPRGAFSAWHRVDGDEIWHYIAGDGLILWRASASGDVDRLPLGGHDTASAIRVIPAGDWQAAEAHRQWTLVACAVGPGFAFHGFEMLRDCPDAQGWLDAHDPHLTRLL